MTPLERLLDTLHQIFGGDFPDDPLKIHQAMARAVVIYIAVLALIRLGKSRSIGRISPIDVLLGFILGSLASRGITGQLVTVGHGGVERRAGGDALVAHENGLPVALGG